MIRKYVLKGLGWLFVNAFVFTWKFELMTLDEIEDEFEGGSEFTGGIIVGFFFGLIAMGIIWYNN